MKERKKDESRPAKKMDEEKERTPQFIVETIASMKQFKRLESFSLLRELVAAWSMCPFSVTIKKCCEWNTHPRIKSRSPTKARLDPRFTIAMSMNDRASLKRVIGNCHNEKGS